MYYVVIGGSSALVFERERVAGVGGGGGSTFLLSYLSVSAHYTDADIDMCQMDGLVKNDPLCIAQVGEFMTSFRLLSSVNIPTLSSFLPPWT